MHEQARTRCIARPPSGWWFTAQASWFGVYVLYAPHVFDGRADPWRDFSGISAAWIVGSAIFASISYAQRLVRRLR